MPFIKSFLNAHPVGCVYTSAVSTSPATLFVGTWTALDGVFIVAKAAAGTFSTAGATGGAETVTLTAAQSGSPAHSHPIPYDSATVQGSSIDQFATNGYNNTWANSIGTSLSTATNAAEAHPNLPPYKVYYQWERTAQLQLLIAKSNDILSDRIEVRKRHGTYSELELFPMLCTETKDIGDIKSLCDKYIDRGQFIFSY